jgi:acetyl esterase/lipase
MIKTSVAFLMLTFISQMLFGQEQKQIPLYPDGVPNSKKAPADYVEKVKDGGLINVTEPGIIPFLPEKGKATGTAVIVCPGGGYGWLAMSHEGRAIAQEFNKIGVTAFILKYRLPSDAIMVDKTIGPLQDAQRAIQMIRQHAAEWGINPSKVGIIGFSAGGHLASTLTTHYSKAVIDNKDHINLRPDFSILLYPVISFGPYAHTGSRDNLIGKNPSQQLIDLYSNEKQITADTPPCLLIHAADDDAVPVQNSLQFYDELLKNKVKGEMHIFQAGGHGFGLINSKSKDKWFDWVGDWLAGNGF